MSDNKIHAVMVEILPDNKCLSYATIKNCVEEFKRRPDVKDEHRSRKPLFMTTKKTLILFCQVDCLNFLDRAIQRVEVFRFPTSQKITCSNIV